jgi:hypothetical protein
MRRNRMMAIRLIIHTEVMEVGEVAVLEVVKGKEVGGWVVEEEVLVPVVIGEGEDWGHVNHTTPVIGMRKAHVWALRGV